MQSNSNWICAKEAITFTRDISCAIDSVQFCPRGCPQLFAIENLNFNINRQVGDKEENIFVEKSKLLTL